jgi:ribonucleoside-diphosphate reductase alpha chain
VSKKELHQIHFQGWKKGVKSFYYLRSTSLQRADKVSHEVAQFDFAKILGENSSRPRNEEECLACQ